MFCYWFCFRNNNQTFHDISYIFFKNDLTNQWKKYILQHLLVRNRYSARYSVVFLSSAKFGRTVERISFVFCNTCPSIFNNIKVTFMHFFNFAATQSSHNADQLYVNPFQHDKNALSSNARKRALFHKNHSLYKCLKTTLLRRYLSYQDTFNQANNREKTFKGGDENF